MPTIVGGTVLVPPRSADDCACTFCGLFRAHHYLIRALVCTAFVPPLFWLAAAVAGHYRDRHIPGATGAVGAFLLIATAATVLAAGMWYQPLRRLAHRLRPRVLDGGALRGAARR